MAGQNIDLGKTELYLKKEKEKHRGESNFLVKLWIAITRKPATMSTRTYKH